MANNERSCHQRQAVVLCQPAPRHLPGAAVRRGITPTLMRRDYGLNHLAPGRQRAEGRCDTAHKEITMESTARFGRLAAFCAPLLAGLVMTLSAPGAGHAASFTADSVEDRDVPNYQCTNPVWANQGACTF